MCSIRNSFVSLMDPDVHVSCACLATPGNTLASSESVVLFYQVQAWLSDGAKHDDVEASL